MKLAKRAITKILLFFFLISNIVIAQTVIYDSIPSNYQLYPRNEADNDSAMVTIKGSVDNIVEYDSVTVEILRNNTFWKREKQILDYPGAVANFDLRPKIYADTIEFRFEVKFWDNGIATTNSIADSVVCGDVFLINGQSNAVAEDFDNLATYTCEWVRSFGNSYGKVQDPLGSAAIVEPDTFWGIAQGHEVQTRFAIGVWGLRVGKLISEGYGVPICIINGSVGGTSLFRHRRNNSDHDDLTKIYGRLLYRVEKAGLDKAVKAMLWWQGESDADEPGDPMDYYFPEFKTLSNNWKEDYPGIQKIYTTQIHPGFDPVTASKFREVQRIIPDSLNDVDIMAAHNLGNLTSDDHFGFNGYNKYAQFIFRQISRDFYSESYEVDIDPPNIDFAFKNRANEIGLVFRDNQKVFWPSPDDTTMGSTTYELKDHFYTDDENVSFISGNDTVLFGKNVILLELSGPTSATRITYLPSEFYNNSSELYDGPWLTNNGGVAALSFFEINIQQDNPLPVFLTSFTAKYQNGSIVLNWHTQSEINNLGFILLRKESSQKDYVQITSYEYDPALEGKGTTSQATDYEFIDTRITEGEIYTYLLFDVDYSGNQTKHGPLTITARKLGAPPQGHILYQNYPNPFNPYTVIAFFLPQTQHVQLRIFDTLGKEVEILLDDQLDAGHHEISFESRNLNSGHYFYQIRTEEYSAVRKMLLIK